MDGGVFCGWLKICFHRGIMKTHSFRFSLFFVAVSLGSAFAPSVFGGSVFVSGHDPIWHSNYGGNATGAANLAKTAINYARDGSTDKFLFIESTTTPVPGGNAREANFLNGLGYAGLYDVMDGSALSALGNFRTTLNSYSAIVVASDHGGMLTGLELGFLNSHSADILDYLNSGGGLAAFAESNTVGLITGNLPFGFLPFLVSSTAFGAAETGNTVSAFGASLGLVNNDVNGNFSHNYFASTGGMTAVDYYNGDTSKALSLAYRGSFGETGVSTPDSASTVLLLFGVLGIFVKLRRFRS